MNVRRRVIRQEETILEIQPGGGVRIDSFNSDIQAWTMMVDKDVQHHTTVKITVVEYV